VGLNPIVTAHHSPTSFYQGSHLVQLLVLWSDNRVYPYAQGIRCMPGIRMNSHYAVAPGAAAGLAIGPLRRRGQPWVMSDCH
jgi:hypothetical protein